MNPSVLALILAGGKGARLDPLTRERAKPAVPFGGAYRIIDFTLSNCYNSGFRKILVLTQYKAMSLDRHIATGWHRYFCREMGEFVDSAAPQHRVDESWYLGTADAIYQNIYTIRQERPRYIVVLAGDHIYKMDYRKLVETHIASGAVATVAAITVPLEQAAGQFGVMEVDRQWRVVGFEEKPLAPKPLPDDATRCVASMGIYVFTAEHLYSVLCADAVCTRSRHDFGRDILPGIIGTDNVVAFPFRDENRKREAYWRDVGTLDAYYAANMDLVSVDPLLNLYDEAWPIYTYHPNTPPPKFVFAHADRQGRACDSLVCSGCIVSGGEVIDSILGWCVRVNSYARVEQSILFSGVDIGRHAAVRRCIIEKDVHVPPGLTIGYDHELDRARGFSVTETGVTIVARPENGTDPLRVVK